MPCTLINFDSQPRPCDNAHLRSSSSSCMDVLINIITSLPLYIFTIILLNAIDNVINVIIYIKRTYDVMYKGGVHFTDVKFPH